MITARKEHACCIPQWVRRFCLQRFHAFIDVEFSQVRDTQVGEGSTVAIEIAFRLMAGDSCDDELPLTNALRHSPQDQLVALLVLMSPNDDERTLPISHGPSVPRIPLPATRCEAGRANRSEEHTSELQSLLRISYAVFCLKKKN